MNVDGSSLSDPVSSLVLLLIWPAGKLGGGGRAAVKDSERGVLDEGCSRELAGISGEAEA